MIEEEEYPIYNGGYNPYKKKENKEPLPIPDDKPPLSRIEEQIRMYNDWVAKQQNKKEKKIRIKINHKLTAYILFSTGIIIGMIINNLVITIGGGLLLIGSMITKDKKE